MVPGTAHRLLTYLGVWFVEVVRAPVISHFQLAPGCYRLCIEAPSIAAAAVPGQFLYVRCSSTLDPFLRRPISVNDTDRENGRVFLLFRVAGRGTALLSQKAAGDVVDVMGPLGRGFELPDEKREEVFVVAGGIGIAPLFFLLKELFLRGIAADVFYGAASAGGLMLAQEIKELGHRLHTATDDGTAGFGGRVTELFASYLSAGRPSKGDRLYGCGPRLMLKEICRLAEAFGLKGEISWEERMGCGVGACLGCACKVKDGAGGVVFRRTCIDGPVFAAGEVVFD